MRAYLSISHKDLEIFLISKSFAIETLYLPTPTFLLENSDCDEEELEYLLSVMAGEKALALCLSETAPGIVLALEIQAEQVGEKYEAFATVTAPITWDQVQCALLAFPGDDELVWFATQEIEIHLSEWK